LNEEFKLNNDICFENFDWIKYLNDYEDLKNTKIKNKIKAWFHWINYGKREGRNIFKINSSILILYILPSLC
jgi:hypothetical protein